MKKSTKRNKVVKWDNDRISASYLSASLMQGNGIRTPAMKDIQYLASLLRECEKVMTVVFDANHSLWCELEASDKVKNGKMILTVKDVAAILKKLKSATRNLKELIPYIDEEYGARVR